MKTLYERLGAVAPGGHALIRTVGRNRDGYSFTGTNGREQPRRVLILWDQQVHGTAPYLRLQKKGAVTV